jgi:hypothetical protein
MMGTAELCALDENERMLARGRTDGPHRLAARYRGRKDLPAA